MNALQNLLQNSKQLEERIHYSFDDRNLLALACVHRSFVNENREIKEHNERLEFLGDSILGLLISEYLYLNLPNTPEGDLSYLRSRLVEASSCVTYVQKLNIESFLLLGKGERLNSGRGRETILADFFEALIGAIYLDSGLEAVKSFLFLNFSDEISAILKTPLCNWKALLQDYCQKQYQQAPTYKVLEEFGPDHSKKFKISVQINNKELGIGSGNSKKEAQQSAAQNAIQKLNA